MCLHDFREDCNLVVFFTHDQDCQACVNVMRGFVDYQADYQAEDARVVAIFPETITELTTDHFLSTLPLVILSDPQGATRNRYANLMDESLVAENDSLLFVLDRYGAPYTAVVGAELDDPTLHEEVVKWLRFIGMQCPE